jgi:methylmalonyl-CoA mutase N-terminal domain/subunit
VIVGVNKFTLNDPEQVDVRMIDNADVLKYQVASIQAVIAGRDHAKVWVRMN